MVWPESGSRGDGQGLGVWPGYGLGVRVWPGSGVGVMVWPGYGVRGQGRQAVADMSRMSSGRQ